MVRGEKKVEREEKRLSKRKRYRSLGSSDIFTGMFPSPSVVGVNRSRVPSVVNATCQPQKLWSFYTLLAGDSGEGGRIISVSH